MREIVKKYTVYPFEELSKEVQEKVIQNLYGINVGHDWWESTYEDAERAHLKIKEFDLDRGSYVTGEFITSAPECAERITVEHGRETETYSMARNYLKALENLDARFPYDNIEDRSQEYDDERDGMDAEFLKSLCAAYLNMLRGEYAYQTSRIAIVESISINEYEFTEEGELI